MVDEGQDWEKDGGGTEGTEDVPAGELRAPLPLGVVEEEQRDTLPASPKVYVLPRDECEVDIGELLRPEELKCEACGNRKHFIVHGWAEQEIQRGEGRYFVRSQVVFSDIADYGSVFYECRNEQCGEFRQAVDSDAYASSERNHKGRVALAESSGGRSRPGTGGGRRKISAGGLRELLTSLERGSGEDTG